MDKAFLDYKDRLTDNYIFGVSSSDLCSFAG